jgi:chromosome partitioning protein
VKTVAIYNLKGGVGKTTTAVNLSYLAAASGRRVLLWDLDLQAASSYAFRIRPDVGRFGKAAVESSRGLTAAIRQTDHDNLCLLPGDFAYRKFEELLTALDDPADVFTTVFSAIHRDFDVVFLDCPAGFSRLAEAILTIADAIVVPTIPTVLSLRMVSQLVRQAERCRSRSTVAAFFSMVDRRRTLHRRARELASRQPEVFLRAEVPYASVVEQMAARRLPLHAFAAHEPAAAAFAEIWAELQVRLRRGEDGANERRWASALEGIETLIQELEVPERPAAPAVRSTGRALAGGEILDVVHRFDTDQRDLERRGDILELRERNDGIFIITARLKNGPASHVGGAEARIDRAWTFGILAGEMSPLDALERRIGWPQTLVVEQMRAAAEGKGLKRVETMALPPAGRATSSTDVGQPSPALRGQAVGY